jgi:hypothetical protein
VNLGIDDHHEMVPLTLAPRRCSSMSRRP